MPRKGRGNSIRQQTGGAHSREQKGFLQGAGPLATDSMMVVFSETGRHR